MKRVLVLGATSSIAQAIASELAGQGARLFLAARDASRLPRLAADLRIRHQIPVDWGSVDALDFGAHPAFIRKSIERLGGIDGAVFAVGSLGDQPGESHDPQAARRLVDVNLTSSVSLLAPIADLLERQGSGFILGLSSVAGDRGRQSNYVYGAAKGGFSLYLQGLRNRLDRRGVNVFTLKLGFVDTAMTYGKEGLFLVASPRQVGRRARQILNRPSGVYYVPSFWRWIMLVIRLIPEALFKRLSL
ncbi:MAG: SDR family oxidoreductase [Acidobacteriota bacterium]